MIHASLKIPVGTVSERDGTMAGKAVVGRGLRLWEVR